MAQDEGTVKCFLDHGMKLSDIVTDEVVTACVCASDGPVLYASVGGRERGAERVDGM